MPLALQSKLLRVLQEKTLTRIGGEKSLNLDVRVIAATNRNLTELISARLFREDLYFRLSAFKLTIPPLASRRLDIAPLVDLMLSKHRESLGREVGITTSAMNELMHYGWPGNVRELENVISRAIVMSDGDHIDACHILLDDIRPNDGWQELGDQTASVMQKLISSNPFQDVSDINTGVLGSSVKQTECNTILAALQASKNRAEAAIKLGISPRTLRHKLKKLRDGGMQVPQAYAR
jgi:two-component system response regulator FlrC